MKLYRLLEVPSYAQKAEIKKSFYKLSKRFHPDGVEGHDEKFKEIKEAYGVLMDDEKRKEYDWQHVQRREVTRRHSFSVNNDFKYHQRPVYNPVVYPSNATYRKKQQNDAYKAWKREARHENQDALVRFSTASIVLGISMLFMFK